MKIVAPSTGARVRGDRPVVIRWQASDADSKRLTTTVTYSTDAGRHWHTIGMTGRQTQVVLPAGTLSRATRARVRVRVNDGFNDTVAESGNFRSDGVPPRAQILSPRRGEILSRGAMLYLSGSATEDTGQRLTGRSLRWYVGRRAVARGALASVRMLTPGLHRVRLVARDRYGRTGETSTSVRIAGGPVSLTVLGAPRQISRRARSVRLRVAASWPTIARVGSQRFQVGTRTRSIKVQVKPGRTALHIVLRLGGGKRPPVASARISRI